MRASEKDLMQHVASRVASCSWSVAAAVLLAALGAGVEARGDFVFTDFTAGDPTLSLNGDASIAGDRLRVTPEAGTQRGSVWHVEQQEIALGFETEFTFEIDRDAIKTRGADGFAFVIQNTSLNALGGNGGAMGYGSNRVFNGLPGQDGIENAIAIEFDMWNNNGEGWFETGTSVVGEDPLGPDLDHISVQTTSSFGNGGLDPDASASLGSANIGTITGNTVHTVRIVYVPGTLNIFYDDLVTPALTLAVDLDAELGLNGGRAWVGFTAATGADFGEFRDPGTGDPLGIFAGSQSHDILSWTYTEGVIPSPGSVAVGVLGCLGLAGRRRRR